MLIIPVNNDWYNSGYQGTKSTLIVTKATDDDSGNYTCTPSSGHSTSVVVHVVDGESHIVLGCFYYILYKNTTCSPLMRVCLACKTPAGFLITSHNLPETTIRNVNTDLWDQDELCHFSF